MPYVRDGAVVSRRSPYRLSIVTDIFWSVVNLIAALCVPARAPSTRSRARLRLRRGFPVPVDAQSLGERHQRLFPRLDRALRLSTFGLKRLDLLNALSLAVFVRLALDASKRLRFDELRAGM